MSKPQTIEEAVKAFGGCTKCYGKGYGTGTQFIEAFPDFVGDGYSRKQSDPTVFCGCSRGKQLHALIKERERLARIDEHRLVQHQATTNLLTARGVAGWSEQRVKQLEEASGDAE